MLSFIDIVIAAVIVYQAQRWARFGFVNGFLSVGGFWLGTVIGILLLPFALPLLDDVMYRLPLALVIIFSTASLVSYIGLRSALPIHDLLERSKLRHVNRVVGSAFSVGATLAVVWLLGAVVAGSPFLELNKQLQNSAILRTLNDVLPPAPAVLARAGSLINPSIFPRVFLGQEPRAINPVDLPASQELRETLAITDQSVVRIEATGCGGAATGSGFVAAENTVVTNAHVIAGADIVEVRDQNGLREARVIYYDPDMDLAILQANDLAGGPLPIDDGPVAYGTVGAVVGYPGGGPLEITPAAVLNNQIARGRNIYDSAIVNRSIYVLQTNVVQGNSGGPIVLLDGRVVGVVFATSLSESNMGYAITAAELTPRLQQAIRANQTVSTMQCAMQ